MDRIRTSAIDWSLVARIAGAVFGGYVVTTLATLATTLALPFLGMSRPEALHASSMTSFLFYAVVIMAAFHARSAARVWVWLTGSAGLLGAVVVALEWGASA